MPTIAIETDPDLQGRARRRIAVRLTRWMADRGVIPQHVIVRFSTTPTGSVYSGGLPLEALPNAGAAGLLHVRVAVQIAADRDRDFRDELACEIADAVGVDGHTGLFLLELHDTNPRDVYLFDHHTATVVASTDLTNSEGVQ